MGAGTTYNFILDNCSDLPPLPLRILTRDGAVIETDTNIWQLANFSERGKKHRIDWNLLNEGIVKSFVTTRSLYLVKLYIADRISSRKFSTAKLNYYSLRYFIHWLINHISDFPMLSSTQSFSWLQMSEELARAFLEWCVQHTARKGGEFVCLRAFYRWGVARGYPDFQQSTLYFFQSIRAVNNAKGHNVRFRHLTKGPFSSDELFSIRRAIQEKKGTEQDLAIVMLHLELGLNPYASVQINNADLKCYEVEHQVMYQIDVPRIKKRTTHRETKRRPISNALGQLFEQLQRGNPEDPLLHWLAPLNPETTITQAMKRFVKAAGIISPYTQALLKMNPRRFRTSLATHMAAQGASRFHIAEILDHTDLQSVHVYTQTVSSIADHVAAATDPVVGPLVQRFLGKIIDVIKEPEKQATSPTYIPASTPHLPIPVLNVGGVGLCGKKEGLCKLLPPLSCYLCPYFVAFKQGPHQEMLATLLTSLQQEENGMDERIRRQLDDVCIAIKEVIVQIKS